MLVYHLHTAIVSTLQGFAADAAAWRRAIAATPSVGDAVANKWHAALFPGGVSTIPVGESWTEDVITKAGIVLEDTESPLGATVLGQYVGTDADRQPLLGGQMVGSATVYVHHRAPELCLALWAGLRARVTTMHRTFSKDAGYTSLAYQSGGAMGIQEQVMRGWPGMPVRTFTVRAEYRLALRDETAGLLEDRDLFVAPVDAQNADGVPGGARARTVG